MHELAVTEEIIRIIEAECKERKVTPKKIILELGDFTSYKKWPLKYYYDLLKRDSAIIKDTELVVNEVRGQDLKIKEIVV